MDQDYNITDVQNFMQQAEAYLDGVPYVERYAWFGAYVEDVSSGYGKGLLVNVNGTGLSGAGIVFDNYTAPP